MLDPDKTRVVFNSEWLNRLTPAEIIPIRHKNSSAVRLQRAARTCIGAMCFSRMARDRNATPHPMETIAMRKIVNSNLLSRIYHVPPPRF